MKSFKDKFIEDMQAMLKEVVFDERKKVTLFVWMEKTIINKDDTWKDSISDEFYEYYSQNKKLKKELGADLPSLTQKYKQALVNAFQKLNSFKNEPYHQTLVKPDWVYHLVNVEKNPSSPVFRIYCNVKPLEFDGFVQKFFDSYYKTQCPRCGEKKLKNIKGLLCCGVCGWKMPRLYLKFTNPEKAYEKDFIRKDKFVVYVWKDDLSFFVNIAKRLHKFFVPVEPCFTHKVVAGVGVAYEPTKTEIDEKNIAMNEAETVSSFGDMVCDFLADSLVSWFGEKTIVSYFEKWRNLPEKYRYNSEDAKKLVKTICSSLEFYLKKSLDYGGEISKIVKKMEVIKAELELEK